MFGALVGGVLEYASLAVGISGFRLLVLSLHGLPWLTLASRGWQRSFAPGEA